MQSQIPILVFAQSARFIAESATHAGYTVRVADCFGDRDTRAVAQQCIPLPPLSQLTQTRLIDTLTSLSDKDEPCLLVGGSGIEAFPALSESLPAHITLLGNHAHTLSLLREPERFFSLLDKLELPYPAVSFSAFPDKEPALVKNLSTCGGTGVAYAGRARLQQHEFFQRYIEGQSASVTFIADGSQARLLAFNRQFNRPGSFVLAHILQSDDILSAAHQALLEHWVTEIVSATGLKGLCSLDFIVDRADRLFLLEINPRITASAELLATDDVFHWHMDACNGHLPVIPQSPEPEPKLLSYIFSDTDCHISEDAAWPACCHDLPAAGTVIEKDMPICTSILSGESVEACFKQQQTVKSGVLKNCCSPA